MKFWDITLFLIIVNIFGAFFYNLAYDVGYRGGYYIHKDQTATLAEMQNKTNAGIATEEVSGTDWLSNALGLMFSAIIKVFTGIFTPLQDYVLWLPFFLMTFGVPSTFAYGMGTIFWFIQLIGIAQVFTGRSFRGVE